MENCDSDKEAEVVTDYGGWCDVWLAVHTVFCSCQKQLLTWPTDRSVARPYSIMKTIVLVFLSSRQLKGQMHHKTQ